MEIFKGGREQWFVVTDSPEEKSKLFKVIPKRKEFSIYFLPDGGRREQFAITSEEVDLINEQIDPKPTRSS